MKLLNLKDTGIPAAVAKAKEVLAAGGIVLYPTDTLYGFGVDARNADAVARLQALKGREANKPMSVLVSDIVHMERCGTLNTAARSLAERFLPGPLTLVIPANPTMPEDVMLNNAIGVRIPNDPFCLALAQAFPNPITTTSANLAGHGTPSSIEELISHFGSHIEEIALIIDGGDLKVNEPSTVISCVTETPQILREGALSKAELGL